MSTPIKADCPECKELTLMGYDSWEDMFRCTKCEIFYYPAEVGKENNPDAGYLKPIPKEVI